MLNDICSIHFSPSHFSLYSRLSTRREKPSRLKYRTRGAIPLILKTKAWNIGEVEQQERNSLRFDGFETCVVAENVEVLPIVMNRMGRQDPR
jgi:hypothetical protein